MEFAAVQSNLLRVYPLAEKQVMEQVTENVSKLIFGAAIAATIIATPALAAHRAKPISAQQDGYVTRSHVGGLYSFVPTAPSPSSGRLVQEARRGSLWEGGGP
jgi:hypothetical protein